MKILVFSDTHLSRRFENKKFEFLKKLILDADRVIINGDFWDGYTIGFDQFMKSKWNRLFPYLKSKKTVYINGNHDRRTFTDKRVYRFCDKYLSQHQTTINGFKFVFEHGHRLASARDENIQSRWLLMGATHFTGFIENVSIRLFGKNILGPIGKAHNSNIKRKALAEFNSVYFVCGHTHVKEYDKTNRFINHGIIRHGLGQYLTINDGKILINEEWYE